jgi:hypothetical protein
LVNRRTVDIHDLIARTTPRALTVVALREAARRGAGVEVLAAFTPPEIGDLGSIGNPSVRIDYAISTSLCTPGALAQAGGHAIGTQGGPSIRLKLLADAGFRKPVVAADTGSNRVLAAMR